MNEIKKINSKLLLIIAITIMMVWIVCLVIRFTPLIQDYIVNLITSIVMNNTINLLVILAPTIVMYRITNKLENLEKNGGKKDE